MTSPFSPASQATALTVTGTSSRTAVTGPIVRIANSGANVIFIKFGSSTVEAAATDTAMLPNTVEAFAIGGGVTHVAAIAGDTGNTAYVTNGDGM